MPDKTEGKKIAEDFSEMFATFGKAMSEIFNDPKLKEKAKDLGKSMAESAETFARRFKDEEVKTKFRKFGKAAEKFGRGVGDYFR